MTLGEAAAMYLASSGRLKTASSKRSFRQAVSQMGRSIPAGTHVDDITPDQVAAWCQSEGLASNTIKTRRAHMKALFAWLHFQGITSNAVHTQLDFLVSPGHGGNRTHTWLDKATAIAVIDAVEDGTYVGQRNKTVLQLGMYMGLRIGDMVGLCWSSFNADCSVLTLEGKGGVAASLSVPEEIIPDFRDWRLRCVGAPVIPSRGNLGHLNWGYSLGEDGIRSIVQQAGEAVDVHLNPHDLRRTFAGLLEEAGVPLADISTLLRHKNLATTSTYLESNPRRAAKAIKAFALRS